MVSMTIGYVIGIVAVGIMCYHLGYWSGWDKGIQHWHKEKCPRCKSLLVFPRGDTSYCEECGWHYHPSKVERKEACRTCFSAYEPLSDNFIEYDEDDPIYSEF